MADNWVQGYHVKSMTSSHDSIENQPAPVTGTWVHGVALGGAAIVLILFRLHAFEVPLENDECNYAHIAARLLGGDRLYVDIWDHQPFGVFVLFASAIALFGDAPEVFRWTATAFSLCSMLLIFRLTRRLAGPNAGSLAAILFAIVSSDPGTAGDGCNREIYMNTLVLLAWYCCANIKPARIRWIFAAGAALALASALKTIIAVHWIVLAVWLCTRTWNATPSSRRWKSTSINLLIFAAAPAALWVIAAGYFAATDRWREFVDAVFWFNISYSESGEAFLWRFVHFFTPTQFPFVFDSAWPLWIAGAASVVWLSVRSIAQRRYNEMLIAILIIGGYLAACLPARFWPHYYYLLIPGLVIGVSVTTITLIEWCGAQRSPAIARSSAFRLLLLAALLIALLTTQYRCYLRQPPFGITVARYNSRDFWGRAQGKNVRRVTSPDDSIFVYGNDASIYYYAERRCASRYTMITGIAAGLTGADRRREILMGELRQDPPRLIIVLFDEQPFPAWTSFLSEQYGEPIGWDFHDRTRKPIMFVLAHKDQPIEPIDWDWDRSAVGGWHLGDRP